MALKLTDYALARVRSHLECVGNGWSLSRNGGVRVYHHEASDAYVNLPKVDANFADFWFQEAIGIIADVDEISIEVLIGQGENLSIERRYHAAKARIATLEEQALVAEARIAELESQVGLHEVPSNAEG